MAHPLSPYVIGAMLCSACAKPASPDDAAATTAASQTTSVVATSTATASGSVPSAVSQLEPAPPPAGATSCGALDCLLFDTPLQAFSHVLTTKPRLLAVGETHAQKGMEHVPSGTKRFTELLLPLLRPTASDLLLELWVADGRCGKKETKVAKKQEPVTQKQAATNQNQFVVLRDAAVKLGLRAHILQPSCEEYQRILDAGDDAVAQMLAMIARLTAVQAKQLLAEPPKAGRSPMVVAYGGAMHNDLAPLPGREDWSFGPELTKATDGRYVELDLIIPEFVGTSDTWKSLPWYEHFDPKAHPDKTTLFRPRGGSFVLIFPRTK